MTSGPYNSGTDSEYMEIQRAALQLRRGQRAGVFSLTWMGRNMTKVLIFAVLLLAQGLQRLSSRRRSTVTCRRGANGHLLDVYQCYGRALGAPPALCGRRNLGDHPRRCCSPACCRTTP